MRLGPFTLVERIGEGGMGLVWRAEHSRQRTPVAIKVIRSRFVHKPAIRERFRTEVRAVARLLHAGVVMVFDIGEIDGETERATTGELVAGCPYLAMELATEGALSDVSARPGWPRARSMLLQILDALAHAHARGVVHRDLKPSNVLVTRSTGGDRVLKLSDFGLAYLVDDRGARGTVSGTPSYMAPEQIGGDLREQGPWTDLYALGVLAYRLIGGRPLFDGSSEEVIRHHLSSPIPPLENVPATVNAWLRNLLAKDPRSRYRSAAEAVHDLEQIAGDPQREQAIESLPERLHVTCATVDRVESGEPPTATTAVQSRATLPPPATWMTPASPFVPMNLVGTGLGLYGLRPVPLIGRQAERDRIWSALHHVHDLGEPRVLVLRGAAGTGKSRLAEWACERALEVGAAIVLRARHSRHGGPGDGIPRMLAEHLGCVGASSSETHQRLRQVMTGAMGWEWRGLAEVVSLANPAERSRHVPRDQWFAVVHRYLSRLSGDGPLILWIDDAQWGAAALAFLEHLLDGDPVRALVLLAVRSEALAERPQEAARIQRLLTRSEVSACDIEPLGDDEHVALIEQLLRLESSLARRVAERTAGNPLFAVQLVGDWVQRGVLEVTEQGFQLSDDEAAPLPEDIHRVWSSRLRRFVLGCRGPSDVVQAALEIAATVGQNVDALEWQTACRLAGASIPADLLVDLIGQGLAHPRPKGWSFCHGMLRESLEETARQSRRWPEHNRSCAAMLEQIYGADPLRVAQRRAYHLLEARQLRAALPALLDAAEAAARADDDERREAHFAARERVMNELGLPADSVERARQLIRHARNLLADPDKDRTGALLDAGEALLADDADPALRAEAFYVRSKLLRARRHPEDAARAAKAALALYQEANDEFGIAESRRSLGEQYRRLGRFEEAMAAYSEARAWFESVGDAFHTAWCLAGMATLERQAGEPAAARTLLDAAIDRFEAAGLVRGLAHAYSERGELARFAGDLAAADADYARAFELLIQTGGDVGIISINRGQVYLAQDRFSDARRTFEAARAQLEALQREAAFVYAEIGLLVCDAAGGDWATWDRRHAEVAQMLANGLCDRDLALCARMAGDICVRSGEASRARSAYQLSIAQWSGLGDGAEEAATRALLDALPG